MLVPTIQPFIYYLNFKLAVCACNQKVLQNLTTAGK